MNITIERKNNHEHIIEQEYTHAYGEYEESIARNELQGVADEYEASLNIDGHEMDDQDDINDVEAITNLAPGEYSFDCGDFTYYIEIKE